MSRNVQVKFTVNAAAYRQLLKDATASATQKVAEQLLADSNEFVKKDSGVMLETGRVEPFGEDASVAMDTPYAMQQYYTGKAITAGKDPPASPWTPSTMWFHKTEQKYKKTYDKIMQKTFSKGMR